MLLETTNANVTLHVKKGAKGNFAQTRLKAAFKCVSNKNALEILRTKTPLKRYCGKLPLHMQGHKYELNLVYSISELKI